MDLIFKSIVIFTAVQRIVELFISKKNEKYIVNNGGIIIPETNYIFMVLLHTSWILLLLYYALFVDLIFNFNLALIGIILFLCGQILRITAIKTLGKRWTTRIAILPNIPAINGGIFSYIRHPNYLGVVIEIAALPIVAGLFGVSTIFSIFNLIILYFRITKEEETLNKHNSYNQIFNLKG